MDPKHWFFFFLTLLGFLPVELKMSSQSYLCYIYLEYQIGFCDICLGCVAPFSYQSTEGYNSENTLEESKNFIFVISVCPMTEMKNLYSLSSIFDSELILDSISKSYTFHFWWTPQYSNSIHQKLSFDSPFSDSNKWTLEVKNCIFTCSCFAKKIVFFLEIFTNILSNNRRTDFVLEQRVPTSNIVG